MQVTAKGWQNRLENRSYKTERNKKENDKDVQDKQVEEELPEDIFEKNEEDYSLLLSAFEKDKNSSNSNMKVKSSAPDESIGSYASRLASTDNKLEVHMISAKVMHYLANLKMSAATAEGKDKEKIQRMINRAEKLMKRVQKKLKQLSKEEQIERQCERAEKKQEMQKLKELSDNLKSRRKKRRREERDYAAKQNSQDMREESNMEMPTTAGVSSDVEMSSQISEPMLTGAGSYIDAAPITEGVSLDVYC